MEHQVKAYAFIAPSLLILTVFVFIPLAGAIGISLMNIDIYMKNISFAGIANYIKMFQDERVANATFHTFYFALLEVPLQMIVALLLLMFMLRNTKLHKLLRTVFYLPYVCSMTAVSIMWSMLLNTHYGMLPYLLGKIGITMPNMLSESLYEAAEIDGATGLQKFFYVTIPGIRDTIGFCVVTTLIMALQVFDQIYVMTGGGPQYATETLVGYIYNRGFQTAPYDLGYASAIAVYLFCMIAIITVILRKYAFPQGGDET